MTTSVELEGQLSAEFQGRFSPGASLQVSGEDLAALLLLAGPEGAALYATIQTLGLLEETHLTLSVSADFGFTLGGTLTGRLAREWSTTKTRLERTGTTRSRREEEARRRSQERSRTTTSREQRQTSTTTGTTTTQREVDLRRERESRVSTTLQVIPVITQAELRFEVR